MTQFIVNKRCNNSISDNLVSKISSEFNSANEFHQSIPGYSATPLYSLDSMAKQIGLRNILVKDESFRFGLNAFKGLGASFAIYKQITASFLQKTNTELTLEKFWNSDLKNIIGEITFCTATDGNHGRAVAWMANQIGFKAQIYMPSDTVTARIESIQQEGAVVRIVDGNYDDAVAKATRDSQEKNWVLISDMSSDNYKEIPLWISAGYSTIFVELEQQLMSSNFNFPEIVFIQTGVGALAVTAAAWYSKSLGTPKLICVEPDSAACLLESVQSGSVGQCSGLQKTIMAGLNCGTPSKIAFDLMQSSFDLFLSIKDEYTIQAMRKFGQPTGDDSKIISGESGAAGLAGLISLCKDDKFAKAKESIKLGSDSTVLIINTEGATDPDHYDQVLSAK